jgi:hypothetical protein
MAYIGSPPASQAFAPGTDTFSGTGSQTAFTLSRNVSTANDILVVVANVNQPVTAYTVSGSTLTFTSAPAAGTNNVYVRYLSTNLQTIAPQQGSVTKQGLDVASGGVGTGAAELPNGTTAQRPAAPLTGYTRVNATTGFLEYWDGSAWDVVLVNGGALGTPASGVASNMTVDGTDSVGFKNLPINSQSTAYTAVLADSGKVLLHPSSDANARTFTIPANSSVAYPLGTALTFINQTSQVLSIAITTDTMTLANSTTTGTRSLAQNGLATAIKVTATSWIISGNGLT